MSLLCERLLPAALAAGRRSLEGLPGYRLVDDFIWSEDKDCWLLHCAVRADVEDGGPVPGETYWYIWVHESYPWGYLAFYPAKEGGITQTFQHQNYNGPGPEDVPWRTGRLCVDTGLRALGRQAYDIEPFHPEERLAWHVCRVQEWLERASRKELTERGDPFELPYVPTSGENKIVFSEGTETFSSWRTLGTHFGNVLLHPLQDQSPILVAREFLSRKGKGAIQPELQKPLGTDTSSWHAWIMLKKVPALPPWEIPTTWGQLRQACKLQGVILDERLRVAVAGLRDSRPHVLLVGFPMPARIDHEDIQVHWLALALPLLRATAMPGFRATEEGLWRADRARLFNDDAGLEWIETENWHRSEITGRGRVTDDVASKSFLIIGAGAVGSAMAELLVRTGVRQITVMDEDSLAVGNLVRHTLTIEEIGKSKAESLALRLNSAAIHSSVTPISERFPTKDEAHNKRILNCDVVIDCTGEDSVTAMLSRYEWGSQVTFISLSLGLGARRLFLFAATAESFPNDEFRERIGPWLRSEIDGYDTELPRDGIGCWYPKLPARADDVWMMTSSAFKLVESFLFDPPESPILTVLEQQLEGSIFTGLGKVDSP